MRRKSPDKWQFDHFDEGMMEDMAARVAGQDAVLLGWVIYQEWASYWPTSNDERFASHINGIPKYIISTTLKEPLEWQNSTLISGNVAEEIAKLKDQPGKNIAVQGSPTLVESLLQADLLDELKLMVHPVVAGSGKGLFGDRRPEEDGARGLEDDRHGRLDPHLPAGRQVRRRVGRYSMTGDRGSNET